MEAQAEAAHPRDVRRGLGRGRPDGKPEGQARDHDAEPHRDAISKSGQFSTPQAKEKLLALYEQAEKDVLERINQRGK